MKVGFNTYEQRPQFKASFAKTAETKKALKALCEQSHEKLYEVNTILKKVKVKDIIEVSIINNEEYSGYLFKNTATNDSLDTSHRGFFLGISDLLFSNGKSISDYQPKPLSRSKKDQQFIYTRMEKELRKEAGTVKDRKVADEILDIAFDLEERYRRLMDDAQHLNDLAAKKEKAHLMKELDLLD